MSFGSLPNIDSRKEIALKMGITINAVEKHITRATMKIQEKLEEVEA